MACMRPLPDMLVKYDTKATPNPRTTRATKEICMPASRYPATANAKLTVDVALTPVFVPSDPAQRARSVYIVVDVVRATTTLSVMLDRGCSRVLVAPGIAEARAAATASTHDSRRALLGGESGGVAPAGFDFGNSPREYAAADLAGRELIFATTNGTRALRACAGGFAIFAGSFRNAGAVAEAAIEAALRCQEQARAEPGASAEPDALARTGWASEASIGEATGGCEIVVVCAGRLSEPAFDDTLCAGYLITRLIEVAIERGIATTQGEGARIASAVWGDQLARDRELAAALADCDAGQAVSAVGLEGDLNWCAALDASTSVPYVATMDTTRNLLEVLSLANSEAQMED